IMTAGTVAPNPSKVQVVREWPSPKTLKGLRGFLGLSGFYQKFIRGYAQIAQPLTHLLQKNSFIWSSQAETAFNQLKDAMSSAPILTLPDFSKTFVIQTDASNYAMGVVLLQQGHPLA
ncbi:transposon TF2-1 polyprotein, partial [Trifolium medium]|nr:transposon TF2-1 polyprotein [Trifolium medium]